MFPFKFILNEEIMEDADGTIFEIVENADRLTANVSWKDEDGCINDVDYSISQVEDNIDKRKWIVIK